MNYQDIATQYAKQYGIDPNLFKALVAKESNWNPEAVSHVGAQGLTQVMPDTAKQPGFGVTPLTNPLDPNENLRFGAEYFAAMLNRYDGDVNKALAAYNWGAGHADKWDGKTMSFLPEETRNYIADVTANSNPPALATPGSLDVPEVTASRLSDGAIPDDILQQQTEAALLQSQQVPFDQIGQPAPFRGDTVSTSGPTTSQVDPEATDEPMSAWDRIFGPNGAVVNHLGWQDMTQEQRDRRWLALGAGMLSGNTWYEGLGQGAQNVLGLEQQEDQNALMEKRISNIGGVYNRPFNVRGRDPETGLERVMAGTMVGGQVYVTDDNGDMVPATSILRDVHVAGRGATQDVEEGAGGIPNASYVSESGIPVFSFKREAEQKNYGYAIRAIGAYRDLEGIWQEMGPEAITSLRTGLESWAANNANAKVTSAVLNEIIGNSGLSGASASTARAFLQAILRADTGAAYTGTEIGDYASAFLPAPGDDPQDIEQKRRLMERELFRFVGTTGAAAPYLAGVLDKKYDLPGGYWRPSESQSKGALDSSNTTPKGPAIDPEIEEILKGYD